MANTPVRTVRIDDERWDTLGEYADRNNLTASDAIRELIDRIGTPETGGTPTLDELRQKVTDATQHLDTTNRDPGIHPLESLAAAGRVIGAQREYIRALEAQNEP